MYLLERAADAGFVLRTRITMTGGVF
jgi:hypothetical protein